MKIALVVPGFSAHERDWAIPAVEEYVRHLGERAELHVFALRWPPRAGRYRVYRASAVALGGGHHLGWRVVGLWLRVLAALLAEHRRRPFDLVHGFWADEPGWLAVWAARRLGRPSVVSLQGGELVEFADIDYGLLRLPGRRALVRWALAHATVVTAGSAYHAQQACRFSPALERRIVQLHTGVDAERFRPPPPSLRPQVEVVNVGSLLPVKQQEMLLRAVAHLPGARADIAGDGPRKHALAALAAALGIDGQVRFLGRVPYEAMPPVYQRARIYVQTSRHEGQSTAVAEAAACGLPVVGTPVGVVPELGVVAETETTLPGVLRELLDDEARRAELGQRARAAVETAFAADRTVSRWLDLYARMATSRPLHDPPTG